MPDAEDLWERMRERYSADHATHAEGGINHQNSHREHGEACGCNGCKVEHGSEGSAPSLGIDSNSNDEDLDPELEIKP